MPTDRGPIPLEPPALAAEQAYIIDACDRTAKPEGNPRLAVGVGLHLLFLAFAGMVAAASLAAIRCLPAFPRPVGPLPRVTPARQTKLATVADS